MDAIPVSALPAASPKTKKVRMPDGTIKIKVQQADGTWKWAKNTTKPVPTPVTIAPAANQSSSGDAVESAVQSKAPLSNARISPRPQNSSEKAVISRPAPSRTATQKRSSHVKLGRVFKAARILDAVLPEHLQIGHELAEDLGGHDSDNNDTSSDNDAQGPSKSSSKQLAKLAASGVKVKTRKAKHSVFRTGEVGSSGEDSDGSYAEKLPASSSDDIATLDEKTGATTTASAKKDTTVVAEKEIQPLKKRSSTGRRLRRRTSRLAQGVAWTIALMFPLLFLSKSTELPKPARRRTGENLFVAYPCHHLHPPSPSPRTLLFPLDRHSQK